MIVPSSRVSVSLPLLVALATAGCGSESPADSSDTSPYDPPEQVPVIAGHDDIGPPLTDGDDIVVQDDPRPPGPTLADPEGDPTTCAMAEQHRTYVGCEFWPTITYNPLYEDFDFAVVLANGGSEDAQVTVSGGALPEPLSEVVPAFQLKAIVLPWVSALKGPELSRFNTSGGGPAPPFESMAVPTK